MSRDRYDVIKILSPFVLLFLFCGILAYQIFFNKKSTMESVLIGKPLPSFYLPSLFTDDSFTSQDLKGKVALLNVWASWCYACAMEQPMLMSIKENYHVPVYGIDYKDNPDNAKHWLAKYGNPYEKIGSDQHGNAAIDLGIYGTPETFVINPEGKIIYRHVGVIDKNAWENELYPLIKKYLANS